MGGYSRACYPKLSSSTLTKLVEYPEYRKCILMSSVYVPGGGRRISVQRRRQFVPRHQPQSDSARRHYADRRVRHFSPPHEKRLSLLSPLNAAAL